MDDQRIMALTGPSLYAVLFSIPVLVLAIVAIVDIWRRRTMEHRVLWTVACLLFWPTLLAYFMLRPASGGNRQRVGSQEDPRGQLMTCLLLEEEGPPVPGRLDRQLRVLRGARPTGR